jgi:GT2 family glycosyltransferase
MSVPKLSISLVNTNNRTLLQACLASLYGADHEVEFETVLVDNCSTDGSAEMVRSEFPQVQVLENERRQGFAANHNKAISVCRANYVLVLNEDTIIRPGALRVMCDYLDTHPRTGCVGCRLENPDGTLQPSCYKFPSPLRALWENLLLTAMFPNNPVFGDYRKWAHDKVRDVEFVIGAAMVVRREVFNTTGYLDDGFFIYSEETDWCLRMHRDGWKVTFIPDGTIVHYGGQSSVAIKDRQFCEFNRSILRYMRKNFGVRGAVSYRCLMIFGACARVVGWRISNVVRPSRREYGNRMLDLWGRHLKWWLGLGPHEGIRELATAPPAPGPKHPENAEALTPQNVCK